MTVTLPVGSDGLWFGKKRHFGPKELEVTFKFMDEFCDHIVAIFSPRVWDTEIFGIIYTNPEFLAAAQEYLGKIIGKRISGRHLGYSEAGMQGDNHVDFDASRKLCHKLKEAGMVVAQEGELQ